MFVKRLYMDEVYLYVALNQISTHYVDLLMGTKQDTSEIRPGLDLCQREVCVHMCASLLLGFFFSEDWVPFKPAAGHCRTSGMCTWR